MFFFTDYNLTQHRFYPLDLSFVPKGRTDVKTEKLGDYITTLQNNYKLDVFDQFHTKKARPLRRRNRSVDISIDPAPRSIHSVLEDNLSIEVNQPKIKPRSPLVPIHSANQDITNNTKENTKDDTKEDTKEDDKEDTKEDTNTEDTTIEDIIIEDIIVEDIIMEDITMEDAKHDTKENSTPDTNEDIIQNFNQHKSQRYSHDLTEVCTKRYEKLKYSITKVYAKDIDCPEQYVHSMEQILPKYLLPHGSNDLFSLLPDRFKATNLMCYLGQDDTGTPIHRDLCGTMGHNIMTMSSPGALSEWCIVVNKDREKLAEIIKPSLNEQKKIHRFDADPNRDKSMTKSCFMESDRAWLEPSKAAKGNLQVQVILQRTGDMVIIPSRAYHQVRNKGVSVKIAWNRITADTLDCAFEDQLPLYRIINRPEVYKCKAIVYFTLKEWSIQLSTLTSKYETPVLKNGVEEFIHDSRKLLSMYYDILSQEMLSDKHSKDIVADGPGEYFTVKCDFCHSDVFYRYYHCTECNDYDLCMNCYIIGRSCKHVNNMTMQQGPDPFDSLLDMYKTFACNANSIFDKSMFIDRSNELRYVFTMN